MSDIALLTATLENAQKENENMKNIIAQTSAQLRTYKQCVDEYLAANINLRSSMILLEDSVKNLSSDNQMLKERIVSLELDQLNANPSG